jgi:hypothetical protein
MAFCLHDPLDLEQIEAEHLHVRQHAVEHRPGV